MFCSTGPWVNWPNSKALKGKIGATTMGQMTGFLKAILIAYVIDPIV